jgi:phosphoribosylanthranilate isomerase
LPELNGLGKPVILAGGLNESNVADAISRVRPFAVDVSSGVESAPGVKSAERLERFCAAVRAADQRVYSESAT